MATSTTTDTLTSELNTLRAQLAAADRELAAAHAELAALRAGLRDAAIAKRLSIERYASRWLEGDFDALGDRELMIEVIAAVPDGPSRRSLKAKSDDYVVGVFETTMTLHPATRSRRRRTSHRSRQPEHLRLVPNATANATSTTQESP